MKILTVLTLMLCLLLANVALAQHGPPRLIRAEGYVVDEVTLQESANAKSKKVVLKQHSQGAKLVFCTDEGVIYQLIDQTAALERVGRKYAVMGSLTPRKELTVNRWQELPKEKKKKKKRKKEAA